MSDRARLLQQIHNQVNTYPYAQDSTQYGQPDFWEAIGHNGRGDCEDYVLEKRQRLVEAGVPEADMRIALVKDPQGQAHAVLVVKDGEGDWVADQQQSRLMTVADMKRLGYQGDKLQVPGQWMWERWEI